MLGGQPVEAGVEHQRLAAGSVVGLDLAEEDDVVAGLERRAVRRQTKWATVPSRSGRSPGTRRTPSNLSVPEVAN